MNIQNILDEIYSNLTGDPSKDGPYLKEQSDKYAQTEFSKELDREFAKIMYETTEKEYKDALYSFLDNENKKIDEQLENARKKYVNLNYNAGLDILGEIIRNNFFAWNDTEEYTYKCFGTPLEYLLYKNIFEDKNNIKPIKSVGCNLAKVYWMYAFGLIRKQRYDEALNALERARSLNPADPEIYIQFAEIGKFTNSIKMLKMAADTLLKCAVSKEQVGKAYFTYSFYFSEMREYEKAAALLQMSKIFRESDLHETELKFISNSLGHSPKTYTSTELMNILITENIQPGPSAAVVHLANTIAKDFDEKNDLRYAKYFYDIVYELTEDEKTLNRIQEIEKQL